MYLALNNLQKLICHKTKPNQIKKIKRILVFVCTICLYHQNLIDYTILSGSPFPSSPAM